MNMWPTATAIAIIVLCLAKYSKFNCPPLRDLLIILRTVGGAQNCLNDQLPTFLSSNSESDNGFRGEFLLSPSVNFTCAGQVIRWQAYMKRRATYIVIAFFVLRLANSSSCNYQVVGRHALTDIDVNDSLLLDTAVSNPMPVQPGDVVGVYSRRSRNNRLTFSSYQNFNGRTYKVSVSRSSDVLVQNSFSCDSATETTDVPFVTASKSTNLHVAIL